MQFIRESNEQDKQLTALEQQLEAGKPVFDFGEYLVLVASISLIVGSIFGIYGSIVGAALSIGIVHWANKILGKKFVTVEKPNRTPYRVRSRPFSSSTKAALTHLILATLIAEVLNALIGGYREHKQ